MVLALLRARKPKGRRLRRLLIDEVLPQLARDGRYDPQRRVNDAGEIEKITHAGEEKDLRKTELELRGREVDARLKQLEMQRREMESRALLRLVGTLRGRGRIGDDILESLEVTAAEIESGRALPALKPPADDSLSWESPSSIAERLGVTSQRVGRTISALGLRGVEGLSRAIVNKAEHCDKTVTSYLYAPEAVRQIEDSIAAASRR